MVTGAHLVVPMGGHYGRFSKAGFDRPRPLLRLYHQPTFWWAVESVRRVVPLRSLTFVVLRDHVERFRIDRHVRDRYPEAALVVLPSPTSGLLVTAMAGCRDVPLAGPVIFNTCDHAFNARSLASALPQLARNTGALLSHFRSRDAAHSYAEYSPGGLLIRTAENQAISDKAIAGTYGFASRALFLRHANAYLDTCSTDEPLMTGVYDTMVTAGAEVRGTMLDQYVAFGTPDEFARAADRLVAFHDWPLTETSR